MMEVEVRIDTLCRFTVEGGVWLQHPIRRSGGVVELGWIVL